MKKLEFTKYWPKMVTEKQILKLERKLKIKIPKSYKKYILKYNGFGVWPNGFICKENQGYNLEGDKHRIKSVYLEGFLSLSDIMLDFDLDRIPKDLLTIGRCDGGSQRILIGLYGEKKDKIYYWDHNREEELDDNFQSYINIYYLCDSFQDLINIDNLMSYDEEELDKELRDRNLSIKDP